MLHTRNRGQRRNRANEDLCRSWPISMNRFIITRRLYHPCGWKSKTIAGDWAISEITNPFFPLVVRGAEDAAPASGYFPIAFHTPGPSAESIHSERTPPSPLPERCQDKGFDHSADQIRRSAFRRRQRLPVRQRGFPDFQFRPQPDLNRLRIGNQPFYPLDEEFGSHMADLVSVLSDCRQPGPE